MTEDWTSGNSGRGRPPRRRSDPPGLVELRREVRELRRGNAYRSRRRRRLVLPAVAALVAVALIIDVTSATTRSFTLPSQASLSGMSVGARIVAIANSQVGYTTNPSNSYCNKFSAYWGVGSQSCPASESSEQWCADFAAWAWQKAGVRFSYGFGPDEINASAASFYAWGVSHGSWHSAYSTYRAQPGDVAVYGLSLGTSPSAAHVAIVTGDPAAQQGPDVINGDGDRTGFSVVEAGTDQLRADTGHGHGAPLAGYVSPD